MRESGETRYSVLDLAPVRRGGTIAESFRNTLDLAQHAERWGFQRFWLAEHHNMVGIASAATAVLIGYVAGGTSRIRVGSGGIMLPNHAPLVIAEQFGTLETLYPGRIDLGLGRAPGTDGATVRALRRDPRSTGLEFPDQVQELLQFLAPERPGQFVRAVPGAGIGVPVWLLGSSTFSAQLAALLGLPFAFASHFAPQDLMQAISLYRLRFKPSQWLAKPYVTIGLPITAADSDARAEFLATTPLQRVMQLVRGEPFLLAPPVSNMEDLWNANERVMVQSRLTEFIVGGPETVKQRLRDVVERTGADEVIVNCDLYEHSDRLHSYEIVADAVSQLNTEETLATAAS